MRVVIGLLGIALLVASGCSSSKNISTDAAVLGILCVEDDVCYRSCDDDPDCVGASQKQDSSGSRESKRERNDAGDEIGDDPSGNDTGDEIGDDPSGKDAGNAEQADADAGEKEPERDLYCGDGIEQEGEQCDDGDYNERNGCTTLCEFSCTEDDDCDDDNSCNGVETCTDQHACEDGDEEAEEGTECAEGKSCRQGLCVSDVCGDGLINRGEQCDDGNLNPNDGCTPDCEFTCETDADCDEQDSCSPNICDSDTHVCEIGEPLDDQRECKIVDSTIEAQCGDDEVDNDGWCINGLCTCTDCGDGVVAGSEQCDDGLLNGTADSPNDCSKSCTFTRCGNGLLEEDEDCDDGNRTRLDGCDAECRYEFVHRILNFQILKGIDVPPWCAYQSNRLANAYSEGVMIMGVITLNILDVVNRQLSLQIADGTDNFLLHIMDSNDTSLVTTDNDITLGIYRGELAASDWGTTADPLDFPFYVRSDQVTEERLPAEYHRVAAEQQAGGLVTTKAPIAETTILEVERDSVKHRVYNFMLQSLFDLDSSSRPEVPVGEMLLSDALDLPEQSGIVPMGMLCGAIDPAAFYHPVVDMDYNDMQSGAGGMGPTASFCCKNAGSEAGTKYRACEDGVLTGDCDSMADVIQQGCTVCMDMTDLSDLTSILDMGSNCALMEENPDQCFKIINGIEFDVDTDGDGNNDAWSALFGFETRRVRVVGLADP